MATPSINTYHCICTSLLLATTHTLSTLPTRADKSLILPLSSSPSKSSSTESSSSNLGYTILLSLLASPTPTIIRREDGFEKRFLYRCGRCRLVVGYGLDESHFASEVSQSTKRTDMTGKGGDEGHEEEKVDVLYILPGSVMSTEVMAKGRKISEAEVELDGSVGVTAVGVWE